jgi:hypothetical protein
VKKMSNEEVNKLRIWDVIILNLFPVY